MQIVIKNNDTLLFDEFEFKCSIGKRGVASQKIEGDKKTPSGTYALGQVYFRNDRLRKPETKLKTTEIKKKMGWCDDPNSRYYNKPIFINKNLKNIRYEKLFRKDNSYDIFIPIKYNSIKPKKNKGSAIFLHLTNNYEKTLGCISMTKRDMLILLKIINRKTKIKILNQKS